MATTLAQVVEDWKQRRVVRVRTAETYDNIVSSHFGPLMKKKVRDLSRRDLEMWLQGLKRADGRPGSLSESSKYQALTVLMVVLRHAQADGIIGILPMVEKSRRPKAASHRERILSGAEEERLLHYISVSRFRWLGPIVEIALVQGLRMGEVMGLRWDDVDFATGKLHVRHSLGRNRQLGPTKGGRPRTIYLLPRAREALLELKMDAEMSGMSHELVFVNKLGLPRQLSNVQRRFAQVVERAALPVTEAGNVSFHTLRHTCATRLANAPGVDLHDVLQFLGHSNLTITMKYVHHVESQDKAAAMAEAMAVAA